VKESHIAIANRPQEECPFKHAESYKTTKITQKDKTKSIKTDEGDKKVAAIMVGGCILISCLIRFLF
jgi:tRNA splicing ligase